MGKLTLYVEDFLASLEQYDETVKDGLKTELKKCEDEIFIYKTLLGGITHGSSRRINPH